MDLQLEKHQDWVLVRVDGRVDSFNFELVSQKINTLLRMGKIFIVVDLSSVNFINLPFVRLMLSIGPRLSDKSGKLAIVGAEGEVKRSLRLFSKGSHIEFHNNIDHLPSTLEVL